jgi:hypothetical protein
VNTLLLKGCNASKCATLGVKSSNGHSNGGKFSTQFFLKIINKKELKC